ncbi:Os05g0268100 [Oryza sativa Japonica Group]|uniref:Os05g0268100 protein n=1 Tax=Oryza sativa subsp. japonica TaxID=39947 RepID=A0A0P0WK83_ORYSJ|nr:Os05g0268100 [Oryza sativa Japonica Group]
MQLALSRSPRQSPATNQQKSYQQNTHQSHGSTQRRRVLCFVFTTPPSYLLCASKPSNSSTSSSSSSSPSLLGTGKEKDGDGAAVAEVAGRLSARDSSCCWVSASRRILALREEGMEASSSA